VRARHAIVVLNLPVPDDRRVWAQASALRDAGTDVTVLCPAMRGHRPGRRVVDGIEVRYLRTYEGRGIVGVVAEGVWNTALVLAWLPWLVARRVRTLQVCNPPDTLFPVLALARLAGVRGLYDQHDLTPAMASARPGFERLRPLLELFERCTVRAARRVITTSLEQQRRLRDRYGVDADVVRSAPHPSDHRHAPRTGRPPVLGYLGVVGEQEGLEDLIDAAGKARAGGVDVDVRIAGDGPFLPDAKAYAARVGVDVTFTGWLQGEELETFLRDLDAVVVSDPESEYNHHCAMNKVIEARARAMPVVMRPLHENGNLVGDDAWVADGWSVDAFAAAIADFAASTATERAARGAALRARYDAEVAWPQQAARYVEVVRELRR
jgi:glycosyltransferase involved in cell wall biosynthesis